MKNIFIAITFLFSMGAFAQQTNNTPKAQVASDAYSPSNLAKKDFEALNAFVKIEDESKAANILKILETKHSFKTETNMSDERKAYFTQSLSESLKIYMGEEVFAKVKANTALYNKLTK